ncbi:C40 family peptidase [Stutzerimonas stutzeri]
MPVLARSLLVLLITLLLSACSGNRPVEQASVRSPAPAQALPGAAEDVLFTALGLVGTPYRYGGNTPASGFDCSGLIGYVYRGAAGLELPRTTGEMSTMRGVGVRRDALQAGDLLFFATAGGRRVSHAAIYVGEGRFVHAPSSGGTVRLDHLSDRYWQRAYLSAKRILDNERLASTP